MFDRLKNIWLAQPSILVHFIKCDVFGKLKKTGSIKKIYCLLNKRILLNEQNSFFWMYDHLDNVNFNYYCKIGNAVTLRKRFG